jgi:mxaK protein
MKRRHVHVMFGCAALGFALLAGYHGARLEHANAVNDAIARAHADQLDSSVPEAVFARALALSRDSDFADAAKTYKLLIEDGTTELRARARYNLGNAYLREALKNGVDEAIQSLPLIELAKHNYRDLLRDNPLDWDARYNLELALRLAPEVYDAAVAENGSEVWNKQVLRATPGFRIELP